MEGGAEFRFHRQLVSGTVVRAGGSAVRNGDDSLDCRGVRVLRAAGRFARALFGGAGREFLSAVRQGPSHKTLSARFIAGAGGTPPGFPPFFLNTKNHSSN